MIMGDLNARIGCNQDFVNILNDLSGFPLDSTDNNPFGTRTSQDTAKANKRGKELLSLCKDLDMSILNGRTVGDIFGNFTCFRHNGFFLLLTMLYVLMT